ncbi:MAG: glutathione peroxidase [Planctomycetaceae bacterium]|nr:glutathione peroxidase [Planctomycetaceae bacterium]
MRRLLGGMMVVTAAVLGSAAAADKGEKKESPVLGQKMETLSGEKADLSKYEGKVLLIVNVASKCGATPQYEPLEGTYEKYKDDGLVVLGFPCNQFGSQEPGTSEEIAEFCKENYGVTFPMFSKIDVNGDKAAPLFKYLTSKEAVGEDAGPVKWNFEKFLIGRDGKVVERFRTPVRPDDPKVVAAIERELAKK